MDITDFNNRINNILNSETPEEQEKHIKKLYKHYQALQLHKTQVSGSFTPEQLQEYTNEKIFKYLVINYGLKLTYQEWYDKNYR